MPPKKLAKSATCFKNPPINDIQDTVETQNENATNTHLVQANTLLSNKVWLIEKLKAARIEAAARLRKIQLEKIEALYQFEIDSVNLQSLVCIDVSYQFIMYISYYRGQWNCCMLLMINM